MIDVRFRESVMQNLKLKVNAASFMGVKRIFEPLEIEKEITSKDVLYPASNVHGQGTATVCGKNQRELPQGSFGVRRT